MCFNCGLPQWREVHTAPPPVKEEHIFIDGNTAFYPDYRHGIHPPGPVYQNLGQYTPYMYGPNMYSPNMYSPGICASGPQYYSQPQASFCAGQQFCFPQTASGFPNPTMTGQWQYPTDPNTLTAQAAAAAENNSRLAALPNAPAYIVGMSPAEIAAQRSICSHHCGMAGGMGGCMHTGMGMAGGQMAGTGQATTVAPYKPGEAHQFWCRELDGSWTLRNYSEICLGEVNPGHWEKHAVSGYFFWVRQIA